jgi:hypothetical protein
VDLVDASEVHAEAARRLHTRAGQRTSLPP